MSKRSDRTRAEIHLAASRAAGALRLALNNTASGAGPRLETARAQAHVVLDLAHGLDMPVEVRHAVEANARKLLDEMPGPDVTEFLLISHIARMEFLYELTDE